ncbi:MAG TPA: hypothetical protein VG841_14485 [Caulobacterales bacterium]|nr:hypothetical protein [Caulobacterales bacterium]
MQTTNLLALRMPDGRLSFASYKDDEEKARILAWARANNAQIDPNPVPPRDVALNRMI